MNDDGGKRMGKSVITRSIRETPTLCRAWFDHAAGLGVGWGRMPCCGMQTPKFYVNLNLILCRFGLKPNPFGIVIRIMCIGMPVSMLCINNPLPSHIHIHY